MATLLLLPTEIIQDIGQRLSPKANFRLACTCKDLWQIFSTVVPKHRDLSIKYKVQVLNNTTLWEVLDEVVQDNRIGNYIERLCINTSVNWNRNEDRDTSDDEISESDRSDRCGVVLQQFARYNVSKGELDDFCDCFMEKSNETAALLLMMLCPELHSLQLALPNMDWMQVFLYSFWPNKIASIPTTERLLWNLSSLHVDFAFLEAADELQIDELQIVSYFLRLPLLVTVVFENCDPGEAYWGPQARNDFQARNKFQATKISWLHCTLSGHDISSLLPRRARVEYFEWTGSMPMCEMGCEPDHASQVIKELLDCHSESLKYLLLDPLCSCDMVEDNKKPPLSAFEALETLRCDIHHIVPYDFLRMNRPDGGELSYIVYDNACPPPDFRMVHQLPKSLEELSLRHCTLDTHERMILQMLRWDLQYLPNLKKFSTDIKGAALKDVIRECKARGIEYGDLDKDEA